MTHTVSLQLWLTQRYLRINCNKLILPNVLVTKEMNVWTAHAYQPPTIGRWEVSTKWAVMNRLVHTSQLRAIWFFSQTIFIFLLLPFIEQKNRRTKFNKPSIVGHINTGRICRICISCGTDFFHRQRATTMATWSAHRIRFSRCRRTGKGCRLPC